jgi:hypothetical protein
MAALRVLILIVFSAMLLPAGAAEGGDAPVWTTQVTPGPAAALRVKFNVGKVLVYEGTLLRSQKSSSSYDERNSFYLTVYCADNQDGLDRLAFRRTYTDRKRTEHLANGKIVENVLPAGEASDLINLGPNYDDVGNLRCYAFDKQNRAAYRAELFLTLKDGRCLQGRVLREDEKKLMLLTGDDAVNLSRAEIVESHPSSVPHVFLDETPHYFFPILPKKQVAPGDTWRFTTPMIIPVEQGNPPKVFPTQFNLGQTARLREAREREGELIAIVDYQIAGSFDSTAPEFSARFSHEFQAVSRLAHKVSGEGEAWLDLNTGRIVYKRESLDITLYAGTVAQTEDGKPPKKEESEARINSQYEIKLLPPGTQLKSGAVVPGYD